MFRSFAAAAFSAVFLCAVTPVYAQSQDAAPSDAKTEKEQQICKRVGTTGSRIGGERVCKTAAEWERDEQASKDAARRMSSARGATKGQ